jgi:hypothetical protein
MNRSVPESHDNDGQGHMESTNTTIIVIDGPGDTTVRPHPPNLPLHPPDHGLPGSEPRATPPGDSRLGNGSP